MSEGMPASSSKRLARNTIMLYVRTFLVMAIGLYTSRVILDTLGIENYGIYNVVGGFVSMFAIAGGTLVSATQRFLSYELGKKEKSDTRKVFNAALTINMLLALFLLILFETVGLWFLNFKLNISADRLYAANWVYQCSVLAFLANILSTPYNALIVAHERMSAFAYISLLEVTLKLLVVYTLYLISADKLIVYAILLLLVAITIRSIYSIYCRMHFPESAYMIVRDKGIYRQITGFASMTFLGSIAGILSNQGVNIVMNMFCGVTVNAARGIAIQVEHAVTKFSADFVTALNPQITKTYAAGEISKSMELCYTGSKFSFFLLMLIVIPILLRTEDILQLWLRIYPPDTVVFLKLTLLQALLMVLSKPLTTGIFAVGKLEKFVLWIGGIRLLTLPLCYWVLKMGWAPYYCYYVLILMELILLLVRLAVLRNLSGIRFVDFFSSVICYVLLTGVFAYLASALYNGFVEGGLRGLVCFVFGSIFFSVIVISLFGLTRNEKIMVTRVIRSKIIRKKKRQQL